MLVALRWGLEERNSILFRSGIQELSFERARFHLGRGDYAVQPAGDRRGGNHYSLAFSRMVVERRAWVPDSYGCGQAPEDAFRKGAPGSALVDADSTADGVAAGRDQGLGITIGTGEKSFGRLRKVFSLESSAGEDG